MARLSFATAAALTLAVAACSDGDPSALQTETGPVEPRQVAQQEEVMPGEVLVKLRDGSDVQVVGSEHGAAIISADGSQSRFSVVRAEVGAERELAAELSKDPRVEWAEPNYLRKPHAIDGRLWAFFNPGGLNMRYTKGGSGSLPASYASTNDSDMDAIEGIGVGGAPVLVGSIDTGVSMSHPEFAGRLIAGRDWYNNDNNPEDDDGHGSHTTGTMAGTTVGVAGVTGAAANVRVYVQKVCGRRGCPTAAIASAIRAAADQPGMVAVNVSIGGTSLSQAEADAIDYAKARDVLVIVSAGNSGAGTVECPACDPDAISVGATDWADKKTSYSNYGPGLDIVAPGGNCYSNTTSDGCIYSAYKSGGYASLLGTSMSSPQVTGTAAVVASKTGLRGAQLRARLESTADDKGTGGYDTTFGNGRLNTYRAITSGSLTSGL